MMEEIKKNIDTIALLRHMLDSANERVKDPTIDPDYKALLVNRIPELKKKILVFEQAFN